MACPLCYHARPEVWISYPPSRSYGTVPMLVIVTPAVVETRARQTVPKVLRGLFQRERRFLGLLSRCSYEAVRRAYGAHLEDRTVVSGCVALIQTFGSFAANLHPHVHALFTQGAFRRDGEFVPVALVNTDAHRARAHAAEGCAPDTRRAGADGHGRAGRANAVSLRAWKDSNLRPAD
jgi:hypothetical protein